MNCVIAFIFSDIYFKKYCLEQVFDLDGIKESIMHINIPLFYPFLTLPK